MYNPSILTRLKNIIRRTARVTADGRRIRSLSRSSNQNPLATNNKPILFFNASTRLEGISQNAGFSILTALALREHAIPVVHFVCHAGMSRCVLGTSRNKPEIQPPCKACIRQSNRMYAEFPQFEVEYVEDGKLKELLKDQPIQAMEIFEYSGIPLGRIVLPSLRWVLRRHHLMDDEPTRFLFREFILSAWNIHQNFNKALDEYDPQIIVIFNGQFFPEAIVKYIATNKGIRVISHEVAMRPLTCFFTDGEATAYPIRIPSDFELSNEQNCILDEYLEKRFQGNFSMAGIKFWKNMQVLDQSLIIKAANFQQIVPIFTNVVFDTSQSHANIIFPEMFSWLYTVLELIKKHTNTLFIIRAHPDEGRKGKESQESVAQWIEKNRVSELQNVIFIDSGEPFSSYELIQRSKFVMVYNSTIGMEAAIMGKAVVCAGKARFTQLETSYLPENKAEYIQMVEEFLVQHNVNAPEKFQQNARKFLYFQLYKTSIPLGEFFSPDDQWKGYVHLRDMRISDLSPKANESIRVIINGIMHKEPFLMDEQESVKWQ